MGNVSDTIKELLPNHWGMLQYSGRTRRINITVGHDKTNFGRGDIDCYIELEGIPTAKNLKYLAIALVPWAEGVSIGDVVLIDDKYGYAVIRKDCVYRSEPDETSVSLGRTTYARDTRLYEACQEVEAKAQRAKLGIEE